MGYYQIYVKIASKHEEYYKFGKNNQKRLDKKVFEEINEILLRNQCENTKIEYDLFKSLFDLIISKFELEQFVSFEDKIIVIYGKFKKLNFSLLLLSNLN